MTRAAPVSGGGGPGLPQRKLHRGHFAFMRAVVQGLDTRASWERYLQIEGEHTDVRAVRTTIGWIREAFAAAARRAQRPGRARLVRIDLGALNATPAALPSLEEFAAERGMEDFSQAEQLAAYEQAYGSPNLHQRRRARLITKQLEALHWLEALAAQPPLAEDAVGAWFHPRLAAPIEAAGLATLAQLIEHINGIGYRWSAPLRGIGQGKAQRVLEWLSEHAESIGLRVGQHVRRPRARLAKSELGAVVAPATTIRPLEKLYVPAPLDGSQGAFRLPPQHCLMGANNDYEAILAWLRVKNGPSRVPNAHVRGATPVQGASLPEASNGVDAAAGQGGAHPLDWLQHLSHTQRAYRKEAERVLLWAILERGKPLSSLNQADCAAYRDFLADPQPRARWCGTRARARWSPLWRPFESGLSAGAQRHALVILRNLWRFWVEQNYVTGNPWAGVSAPACDKARIDPGRSFTLAQWAFIEERAQAMDASAPSARLRVALHLLYATGLRLSEVVAARAGDLQRVCFAPDAADADTVEGWLLRVVGKGNRAREVPVPELVASALADYFARRGLARDLDYADNAEAYLLGKTPDDPDPASRRPRSRGGFDPKAGIAAATLYRQLKGFFGECADLLEEGGDERGARRFRAASTHWLRHTHASHAVAAGTPIEVMQQNLGHASLATTTVYVTTEKKARLKQMAAFWQTAQNRRQLGR